MYFKLLLLTLMINTAEMDLSCSPEEVTKPYTFIYTFSKNDSFSNASGSSFLWKKNGQPIVQCGGICTAAVITDSSMYEGTLSNLSATLKIKTLTTQSGGSYSFSKTDATYEIASCSLRVYAKPDSVTCQDPEFKTDTKEVAVVGTVLGVYPHPICRFSWFINNTESRIIEESLVQYNNLTGGGDPSYFNQNCSFKVPARNFTPGKHQFQLLAYPNVTGQDNDTVYGGKSSQTSPKSVVDPIITLDCLEPSVQEGKQFSCTCKDIANTFILSNTTLLYGAAQVSSALQQVTANVTATRNSLEVICQAQLPDGTKTNKTQTVQVYYGPSNVSLRVTYNQTEYDVISLCDTALTVTVNCSVLVTDVSPGVNYQFFSNVTNTTSAPSNMYAVNYTVTSGGPFYFMCSGNNLLLSSLSASTNKTIRVTEPPRPPVIEKYQDEGTSVIVAGDQLTVQEGVTRIRCRVEGGYPPVSGLQLECASQTNKTKDNNVVYIDVNITRHIDGSNCSCTATHNSTCYKNNKAQSVLDVRFGPTIFVLKANNNSGQIIIVENSSVNISCQAEGNPSPSLSLKMDGREIQPFNVSNHKSNGTLTYNKAMAECMDTGVYTCHAETGQAVTDKTVAVYVKCAQQFRVPGILSQSYKEQVNGTVLINVSVFGYPEPTVTLNSNKYRLSSESYTLNYTKQEPPYGTVSLVINIRNASYFQNYTLNINNTEGPLTYSFEIVEGVTPGSEKGDSPAQDVGAIVGGIVAAVLVIVIIIVVVCLVKRKGAPCKGRKDQNPNNSMHSIYGSDETVTVDNAALYNMGGKSEEVVIDNSDLYNMNKTVTVDNSDLYNLNRTSQEVEVDNSDLYNMNRPMPGIVARNSDYKNYSDVVPTITSATSVPLNMRNKEREDTNNPYEDVSSGNKNKPKPTAAPKPKPVAKPKPQAGKQVDQQARNTPPDQTYAMVVKLPNSDKPFAIKEDKDDFFLDPSQQPEVPEKNFENPYEDTQNEKSTEKKLSDKKKNKADKPNGKASEQHKDPSSLAYANKGFTSPDDDVNVYANT